MDQLHEELKQPITDESEYTEAESDIHEEQHSSRVIGRADQQLSVDTSSNSSQSDGDYETCDSAIGSERETNQSSDENSDITRLNLSTRQLRSRNSMSKTEDSSDASNRPGYLKEKKDSINMSKKVGGDNISACSDDQRSDAGDFVDAEAEPLCSRRRGNRTLSGGSADREQATIYNKSKFGIFNQSAGPSMCLCNLLSPSISSMHICYPLHFVNAYLF